MDWHAVWQPDLLPNYWRNHLVAAHTAQKLRLSEACPTPTSVLTWRLVSKALYMQVRAAGHLWLLLLLHFLQRAPNAAHHICQRLLLLPRLPCAAWPRSSSGCNQLTPPAR